MRDTLSYLAGIVDGEGYIGIKKSTWRMRNRKDCVNPTYHERMQIRMVEESPIKLMQKTFGGNYYKEKPHSNNGRLLYCYQISDKLAASTLKILLPYLLLKKRNARTVLKLRTSKETTLANLRGGRKRRKPMLPQIVKYREELYQLCKKLNRGLIE